MFWLHGEFPENSIGSHKIIDSLSSSVGSAMISFTFLAAKDCSIWTAISMDYSKLSTVVSWTVASVDYSISGTAVQPSKV